MKQIPIIRGSEKVKKIKQFYGVSRRIFPPLLLALVLILSIGLMIPVGYADTVTGPAGTQKYFLKSGSTWEGSLDMSGNVIWIFTLTSIDGSSVTGNKAYQFFVQESVFWNNYPIQVHHNFYGSGGHLIQSSENWAIKSSHGFNPGDVPGLFDLRLVMKHRSDGKWDIEPYFRLPGEGWTLFWDGAWTTSNVWSSNEGLCGVQIDAGGDGTLNFDAPTAVMIDPSTLYVDDDWTGSSPSSEVEPGKFFGINAFSTIQDAVDVANDGDTIHVYAGEYSESVIVAGFTSLTIKAEGAGHPDKSVKVNPTPVGETHGFYVISDGVTIEGFEIDGTNFGIWFEGSNNKFSNNYIHDIYHTTNWWDGGVGISLWDMDGGSNYNEITNNVIEDVERTGILLDIAWTSTGTGINTGNTIYNNKFSGTPWGAIEVLNAEDTTINNNEIDDCGDWGIALLNAETGIESNDNTIAGNKIEGSTGWGVGILVYAWAGSAEDNNIHHNDISDINGASIGIWIIGDNNKIRHNTVEDATVSTPYSDSGTGNKDKKNSWN